MATIVEQLRAWTQKYDHLGYHAGNGDVDRDGVPDSLDFDDGNGVDCRGWVDITARDLLGVTALGYLNTAGMAALAEREGWWIGTPTRVDWSRAIPGVTVLLMDRHGNVFQSGGARGHCVFFLGFGPGNTIITSESRGGRGVGIYTDRTRGQFTAGFNLPVTVIEEDEDPMARLTDEQLATLLKGAEDASMNRLILTGSKFAQANVLQPIAAGVAFLHKSFTNLSDPLVRAPAANAFRDVHELVGKIATKLGAR